MTVSPGQKQTTQLRINVSPEFVAWARCHLCPVLGTWSVALAARALLYTLWREDTQRKAER